MLYIFQNRELIKVNKVYLDKEEYNRFLAKQFIAANSAAKVNNSNKVTTTTTTTTTVIQPPPTTYTTVQQQQILPSQHSQLVVPMQ